MAAPDAVTKLSADIPPWQHHWLAETLRLREEHWGPLEDADAVRHARRGPEALEPRILLRAQSLGRREGLDELVSRWRQGALISLSILFILALLTGIGSAAGALGDGTRPVNVLWALGALLGLNLLTLVLWLASLLLRPRHATGLGRLWLWITRKFARGPDAALVPQALMNLLGRIGAIRGLFGAISHGLWLTGLTAALITLLVLLSTASYRFVWATTILQPDTFVTLTHAIGWLPAQLGFTIPAEDMVRASDGAQALPAAAQAQWSVWLIGVLVVYGILPRLVAAIWCTLQARRALRGLRIDPTLPGYAALRDRLLPAAQSTGIDRPVDDIHQPQVGATRTDDATVSWGTQPVLVSLELPADVTWPPADMPDTIQNAGNLDSREQRNCVRDALSDSHTPRLLIACDARQTPDRGTMGLIASLAELAGETRVWLYLDPQREPASDRRTTWRERLMAAGMAETSILHNEDQPLRWLESGND
ncbi:DUF2868 domain-containing protein [Bordetella sp. 02P26C-1]|uniref:DUF2868 domain-containing protein n=1 Tax=Bordetella sp. 02P26C-1 TaxID=2683195 RepID=UPI0013544F27|nr:DUF2868 domain-containing protein [Bordetella sp. 02P26C-1]MVW78406.1 DUF2868 domain-containing protein [Bordetella sp. 02P26C-1]